MNSWRHRSQIGCASKTLDDMVGQRHLLAPGKVLRKIIESGEIPNLVFYGPSGVGKTTLATMIARQTNRKLFKLNGTTASTSDIRDVVSSLDTLETMHGILLYLDEIQYFNKKNSRPYWNSWKMDRSLSLHPRRKIHIFMYTMRF